MEKTFEIRIFPMEYSKIAEMLHAWGAEVRELREGVKEEISFKDTLVFWNGGMRQGFLGEIQSIGATITFHYF